MRKVKFCQQEIIERLTGIIESFPKLEDLHPFYADLLNVLYDKDHYKIALGNYSSSVPSIFMTSSVSLAKARNF
jgi:nucleolar GTP-binding protein